MKPVSLNTTHFSENVVLEGNFSNRYLTNPLMTQQLVAPPAHVWEKIEKILDEQDKKKSNPIFFSASFSQVETKRRFAIYFAAAATVVASIMWMYK